MKNTTVKKITDGLLKQNVNSACWFFMHQPQLPVKTKEKFKK